MHNTCQGSFSVLPTCNAEMEATFDAVQPCAGASPLHVVITGSILTSVSNCNVSIVPRDFMTCGRTKRTMTYFEQLPNQKLSSYIQTFWYCQGNDVVNAVLTIPFLRHEMVFNFADAYSISNHLKAEDGLTHATWISGIQTKPTFSTSSGKHEMVGVLFKADGLHAFTKHHSSDFTNHHIDASLIFSSSLADLLCEMHNAHDGKSKIALLELFLLQHLKTSIALLT